MSALIATETEKTYAARDAAIISNGWQTSLPPKLIWNELAYSAEPSGVHSWNQARCINVRSCPPAILDSRSVAQSVLVFDFGSAMLRVTVPILGTMPREEFRSERGESVQDEGALGFAEDGYSIRPMTCLGPWGLEPHRPRDCAGVGVKLGVQRSSQRRETL